MKHTMSLAGRRSPAVLLILSLAVVFLDARPGQPSGLRIVVIEGEDAAGRAVASSFTPLGNGGVRIGSRL
jgi:hypothetical protein